MSCLHPERSEDDVSETYRNAAEQQSDAQLEISPVFARPGEATSLPKFKMPDATATGEKLLRRRAFGEVEVVVLVVVVVVVVVAKSL